MASANKILDSFLKTLGMLLVYVQNNKGPRVEPWDEPWDLRSLSCLMPQESAQNMKSEHIGHKYQIQIIKGDVDRTIKQTMWAICLWGEVWHYSHQKIVGLTSVFRCLGALSATDWGTWLLEHQYWVNVSKTAEF